MPRKSVKSESDPIMAIVNKQNSFVHLGHPNGRRDDWKSLVIPPRGYRVLDMEPEEANLWLRSYRVRRAQELGLIDVVPADSLPPSIPEPQGMEYRLQEASDQNTVDQILYGDETVAIDIINIRPRPGGTLDARYLKSRHLPILHRALYFEKRGQNRPHIVAELEKNIGEITWKMTG